MTENIEQMRAEARAQGRVLVWDLYEKQWKTVFSIDAREMVRVNAATLDGPPQEKQKADKQRADKDNVIARLGDLDGPALMKLAEEHKIPAASQLKRDELILAISKAPGFKLPAS